MKAISIINKFFGLFDCELRRKEPSRRDHSPLCRSLPAEAGVIDIDALSIIANSIPGMIPTSSGRILYCLSLFQDIRGDVVEIGSWQGRSASYLARATAVSGNGRFYAVDHFKGNVGKEKHYRIGKSDLSDLREGFCSNMRSIGLGDAVTLYDTGSQDAAARLQGTQIRFLFIDGDHSTEGVRNDVLHFLPLMAPGGIIAFDDFTPGFPGVVSQVRELIEQRKFTRTMSYQNTFIAKIA